jgi:hypothetical protein
MKIAYMTNTIPWNYLAFLLIVYTHVNFYLQHTKALLNLHLYWIAFVCSYNTNAEINTVVFL